MAIDEVLGSGSIGFFWKDLPDLGLEKDPERGYLHVDNSWAELELLNEDPMALDPSATEPPPSGIAGALPGDSVLLLELVGPSPTLRFGGDPRASTNRFQARTAIGGVAIDRLRSTQLLAMRADFHGVSRWAGMTAIRERHKTDSTGGVTSWSADVSSDADVSHRLRAGTTINISTSWRVDGPRDRRTLSAPVSFECRSRRPVEVWELLQPLLIIQDLLGLAFAGFVAAERGSAAVDLRPEQNEKPRQLPTLWNGALMVKQPGVQQPRDMNAYPLFDLTSIGGIAGLARWIRLGRQHPRAIAPITTIYRHGPISPTVQLMELAAGIEYWVKANRPAQWTQGKFAQVVTKRCGRSFATWAGDGEKWASAFWRAYNHLKHEPTYQPDPREIMDFVISARYLLAATLLNHVAQSKRPSQVIFNNHRLMNVGSRLRDRFAP